MFVYCHWPSGKVCVSGWHTISQSVSCTLFDPNVQYVRTVMFLVLILWFVIDFTLLFHLVHGQNLERQILEGPNLKGHSLEGYNLEQTYPRTDIS
jgi:hypothetical protein